MKTIKQFLICLTKKRLLGSGCCPSKNFGQTQDILSKPNNRDSLFDHRTTTSSFSKLDPISYIIQSDSLKVQKSLSFTNQQGFKQISNYILIDKLQNTDCQVYNVQQVTESQLKDKEIYIKQIPLNVKIKSDRIYSNYTAIKHKNILQIYEIICTDNNIYLVMEKSEGNIKKYVKSQLNQQSICYFMKQLADALKEVYKISPAHGDLKPSSLLLTGSFANPILKLFTYLECRVVTDIQYKAPEIIQHKDRFPNMKSDM